jgi:glucose uptake protein GlcU
MFRISLALFAVAAVAGLIMAIMHFRGQSPPKSVLAVLHGLFAASALVVLLMALLKTGFSGKPGIAFGVLVVAALGGFVLLSSHVKQRALPSGLVVGHALLAVAGFVVLLLAEFAIAM